MNISSGKCNGRGYPKKPEWGIGERNEGNYGNTGNQGGIDGNTGNQGGDAGNRGGNHFSV